MPSSKVSPIPRSIKEQLRDSLRKINVMKTFIVSAQNRGKNVCRKVVTSKMVRALTRNMSATNALDDLVEVLSGHLLH